MEGIIHFLSLVIAPLFSPIFLVMVVAGFFFGILYISRLNIDPDDIFHIAMAGWVFLISIFIFRIATYITEGTILVQAAGWLGISLGWGVYCLMIAMGLMAYKHFIKKRKKIKP